MIGLRGIPGTYGGTERAVEALSTRLVARGHEVTVYCRAHYGGSRMPTFNGVRLRYLPSINTKHLEAATHTVAAAIDASSRDCDIVHFHGTGPTLFAPIVRAARKPVVATVQGLDYRRAKWGSFASNILQLGAWTSARIPMKTIVVSKTLQQHYRVAYGVDTVYIPNGFDELLPEVGVSHAEGPYILFLGRLVPEKGIHYLIHAFNALRPNVDLLIAGPASHSDDYVRQLRELAAANDRIQFVGPVYGAHKAALVRGATVFCQPSDVEGLPLALLEAMAAGTCALVSDLGEHLEIVRRDGREAAFVFRQGDVADLARQLDTALHDRGENGRRACAGAAVVRTEFRWDDIVGAVEAVYASVCR